MYDLHNAYKYENIVFIYYVQFSIRVSFACEFTCMSLSTRGGARLKLPENLFFWLSTHVTLAKKMNWRFYIVHISMKRMVKALEVYLKKI
jgi:hypothetical protein